MSYELVIRNARIVDGSGADAWIGNVGIAEGKIAFVGPSSTVGDEIVDAEGLVLAPGFVDIHTHYDAQLTWDPAATPSPEMGVTTVVIGNCGFGIAPCKPEHRDLTLRNLTKVEGMPLDALLQGVRWRFESFAEYLESLEMGGLVPNVAAFANHSCIRTFIMGADAAKREANAEEIKAMAHELETALAAGAIGLGTSTLESHNGEGGVPMPSRFASPQEFRAFAEVLGRFGRGALQITKGESPSIEFMEELAEISRRPIQICPMLQDPGHPEAVFEFMDAYAAAAARGNDLYGQVSPFPEIMDFTLFEPYPLESLETWRPAMAAKDTEALCAVYRDEGFRQRVREELTHAGAPFRFSNQWNSMRIKTPGSEESAKLMQATIAELAQERAVHPLDCMLDIALADGLKTEFTVGMFNSEESAVAELLRHPRSTIGLGDAGAHLTFFCQAGTGLYLLQKYVRKRKAMRLEEAVQRLTSQPAAALRIPGRGKIEVGAAADLVLFDADEVGLGPKCTVDDLPGGLERVHTPARGVRGVWVNGERVVDEHGALHPVNRPGLVIREFDA
tara:strand:- start:2722 stop:4407 length:1686 start_codon:yes stop_codon:yes gene_type:complete